MKLEKAERILKMAQLLRERPDINAKELAKLLKTDIKNVYRYLKEFQKHGIPSSVKKQGQRLTYDEADYLTLALGQPELSLIHKLVETALQKPKEEKELNESEIQILKQVKELFSKALWVKPKATSASIKLLFEPTKGQYNGEISIGFVGKFEFNKKGPLHLVSSISVNIFSLIFSTLFCHCKGKPEELLVKSWEVSDDLLSWSFDLEEGVSFHNGKELTAEDVAYTYQTLADPGFGSPLAATYAFVKSFEATSKYKFQIRLKEPHIALLDRLGIPILPKEVLQRYRRLKSVEVESVKPEDWLIGSGPFKLDSFPQEDVMILKANEDYFEEGFPHLEKVIFKTYPTSESLFNATSKGEVDLAIFGLMVSELEQLGETIPFQVYPVEILAYYALPFNLKDKTLSDLRVRKAISHAIDRESLLKRQLKGYGHVSNGPWIPPSWAYNEGLQPVKYDVELAKSLLIEAGWKERRDHWRKIEGGEKLEIEIPVAKEVPDLARLAEGLKLQLSMFKVKIKLKDISLSDIAPNAFETLLLPINCGGDPDKLWRFWHSKSNMNLTSYHNPEVDELLDWGRSVASMGKRKAIYDRIQELIVADHPAAFLCTSVYFIGSNCVLQNADEFLTTPNFFSSMKRWSINREERR